MPCVLCLFSRYKDWNPDESQETPPRGPPKSKQQKLEPGKGQPVDTVSTGLSGSSSVSQGQQPEAVVPATGSAGVVSGNVLASAKPSSTPDTQPPRALKELKFAPVPQSPADAVFTRPESSGSSSAGSTTTSHGQTAAVVPARTEAGAEPAAQTGKGAGVAAGARIGAGIGVAAGKGTGATGAGGVVCPDAIVSEKKSRSNPGAQPPPATQHVASQEGSGSEMPPLVTSVIQCPHCGGAFAVSEEDFHKGLVQKQD